MSRVQAGSLTYPSYPGGDNFSYIPLINVVNRLHEKKKRTIRLEFFIKGHLPSRANISQCKHFGSFSRIDSVKARQYGVYEVNTGRSFFFSDARQQVFYSYTLIKTIYSKHCSKSRLKRAQSTLPVDVCGSKTSQLKLPSYSMLERFWSWTTDQLCSHINA